MTRKVQCNSVPPLSQDHVIQSTEAPSINNDIPRTADDGRVTQSHTAGRSPDNFDISFQLPSPGSATQDLQQPNVASNGQVDKGKGPCLPNSPSQAPDTEALSLDGSKRSAAEANSATIPLRPANASFNMQGMHTELRHTASTSDLDSTTADGPVTPRPGNRTTKSLPVTPQSRRRAPPRDPPHKVEDEELPDNKFHQPAFQRALADSQALMQDVAATLASSSLHLQDGSTIKHLHEEATKLSNFTCPSTRTIGVVGDSGVGKSSLINCLLDVGVVAQTSSGGAACTAVVTEYLYHSEETLTVSVTYYTPGQVQTQFLEHITSYRKYHLGDGVMERDERNQYKKPASLAFDTINGVFGQRFDKAALLQESEDTLLHAMMKIISGSGIWENDRDQVFNTVEMCSAYLRKLGSIDVSDGISSWPLIQKISVRLKAYILSKGLILVDLPGLHDLNSARREVTERHLFNCDEVFAVCPMLRAVTDAGLEQVFTLAQRAGLGNLSIVCTKSDDIKIPELAKDWAGSKHLREQAARINQFEDTINQGTERLEALIRESDELGLIPIEEMSNDEKIAKLTLEHDIRTLEQNISLTKRELRSYVVTNNNADVRRRLLEVYDGRLRGNHLNIFCISSTDYLDHKAKASVIAMPYLHRSGIISLRKHCIGIVTEVQLRAATRFMNDRVRGCLSEISLWVQSGEDNSEQKQAIRHTIDEFDRTLKSELTGQAADIKRSLRILQTYFNDSITNAQNPQTWCQASTAASRQWRTQNAMTYKTFCNHFGEHRTQAAGYRNWNMEATARMREELNGPWESTLACVKALMKTHVNAVDNAVVKASTVPHTLQGTGRDSVLALYATLRYRADSLCAAIEDLHEGLQAELRVLGYNALGAHRTSITGRLMEQTYIDCSALSGRGSHEDRASTMARLLENASFFDEHFRAFKAEYRELVDKFSKQVDAAIEDHMEEVAQTLDILRNDNAAVEGMQDPRFRQRIAKAGREATDAFERIRVTSGLA